MKINDRHERVVAATPEQIGPLLDDFDRTWPTQIAPAPQLVGDRLYKAGLMVWEEVDRPGAVRAFRTISPEELQGEHWFELQEVEGGTLVRHTVDGNALGPYDAIWREQIEPYHGLILEALFDNVEAAVTS